MRLLVLVVYAGTPTTAYKDRQDETFDGHGRSGDHRGRWHHRIPSRRTKRTVGNR